MGFYTAAFGFIIADHGGLSDLIQFAVKKFTLNGKQYVKSNGKFKCEKEEEDLGTQFYDMLDALRDFSGFVFEATDIIYYDDIAQDEKNPDEVCFKNNKKVTVSDIGGCALMVCIAKFSIGSELNSENLDDDDVLDLLSWKKQLIEQNRINDDYNAQLQLFTNCCS
jgi:hypothetical protein